MPSHVHSYEESVYVLDGHLVIQTPGEAARLGSGGYGLVPVGVPHSLRNEGDEEARFVRVSVPLPRPHHDFDTQLVPEVVETEALDADVRDPRTRRYGHISEEHMDPTKQSQELLDVSASMRTALLVYSGIQLKMMVDSDLGAVLSSMFMVQYEPYGAAGLHDHPLEETYLILEGTVEATFDGEVYQLAPGDVAWSGVGCQHSFRKRRRRGAVAGDPGATAAVTARLPVRAGLGLPAHAARRRRWVMRTLVVGGSSGIGLEVARARAARGDEVVLTSRDPERAAGIAESIDGQVSGLALDLNDTHGLAGALAGVGSVDRLVVAAIERDQNSIETYDVDRATKLAVLKLVGYTEVVHALLPRMDDDSSVVLFGGRAKDRPYPGSITVSTVNGGVVGLVTALALEMAPIRVNALHPGIVGDSPFWADKPEGVLDGYVARTPTRRLATMKDIVDAVDFLLENRGVNATNLYVDGGWLVT